MNSVYNFRELIQTKQRQLIGVNPNLLAILASNIPNLLFLIAAENSIVCRLFLCPKTNKNEEKR